MLRARARYCMHGDFDICETSIHLPGFVCVFIIACVQDREMTMPGRYDAFLYWGVDGIFTLKFIPTYPIMVFVASAEKVLLQLNSSFRSRDFQLRENLPNKTKNIDVHSTDANSHLIVIKEDFITFEGAENIGDVM